MVSRSANGRPATRIRLHQSRTVGQLADLLRTSQELSLSLTPDEILQQVAAAAASIIGAEHSGIFLIDPDAGNLVLRASHGLSPDTPEIVNFNIGEGLAGWVAQTGQSLYVADTASDPRFKRFGQKDESLGSILSVPLKTRDEVIGVLCIGGAPHALSNTDEGVLMILANQASAALENARLFKETEARLQEVSALLEVTQSLSSSPSLEQTLERIISEAVRVTPAAEKGTLMLIDSDGRLTVRASYGYEWETVRNISLAPGEGYAGIVLVEGRPMIFDELALVPSFETFHVKYADMPEALEIRSAIGIPVEINGRVLGVLCVDNGTKPHSFGRKDLQLLTGLAAQAAIAIERAELSQRSRDLYLSGIRTLAAAIDAKDPYTRGHSDNVGFYARRMAETMGLDGAEIEQIELAGLLHDIGKIGIADAILKKPGPLDPAERSTMMTHPVVGAQILAGNPALQPLIPLVRHHHEWWAGGGYPDGVAGEEIPLGASILSVADAFDTITSERPYRRASSLKAAIDELRRWQGRQFRPDVVDVFGEVLRMDQATSEPYIQRLRLQEEDAAKESAATSEPLSRKAGQITPLHAKELSVLYQIATEIRSVLDLPTFLQKVLEVVGNELGFHASALYLLEEDGDLRLGAASGYFKEVPDRLARGVGVNGWVAINGVPQVLRDVSKDPRYVPGSQETKSEIVVPLSVPEGTLGTLTIDSDRLNAFSDDDVQLITAVANQVSVAVEVAKLHDEVRQAAVIDGLTKIFNHRYFYQRLDEEITRAARYGHQLQLLLCDVDELKHLNDTFGHLAGDSALAEISTILRETIRVSDIPARYGGDEFAIILPETTPAEAAMVADRMRESLEKRSALPERAYPLPRLSFGLASYPNDGSRSTELVAAADRLLYVAKETGGTQLSF